MTLTSNDKKLREQMIKHEGMIPYAYKDSLGYLTIGIGRLIDKKLGGKLSDDECLYLLENDIDNVKKELGRFNWYTSQDEVRQGVLIELCFNIGLSNILLFRKMLGYLKVKDFNKAADEMKNSKWANQVGSGRVNDMVYRMINGNYQ